MRASLTFPTQPQSHIAEDGYGVKILKNFPLDNSKPAEMEFYLVSDRSATLLCSIHTLLTLCGREAEHAVVSQAREVSVGIENGPRYFTGEGTLELEEGALQTAWHVIPPPHPLNPSQYPPTPKN